VAHELKEAGTKVLVVSTTKMFIREAEKVGFILTAEDRDELRSKAVEMLAREEAVVVGSSLLSRERVGSVEPDWVPFLAPEDGVTLVEADGSRRRPLKGTAAHEPLLPDGATLVVAVGGVRALSQPVGEEHVHRPEVFSELTGVRSDHTIDAEAFAQALLVGLRNVPDSARKAALLADVDPGRSMADASAVARKLWRGGVRKVILSSLPKETPGQVWLL
jgi:probable selenium-dependent hydroxylase accessory protein YqeC